MYSETHLGQNKWKKKPKERKRHRETHKNLLCVLNLCQNMRLQMTTWLSSKWNFFSTIFLFQIFLSLYQMKFILYSFHFFFFLQSFKSALIFREFRYITHEYHQDTFHIAIHVLIFIYFCFIFYQEKEKKKFLPTHSQISRFR